MQARSGRSGRKAGFLHHAFGWGNEEPRRGAALVAVVVRDMRSGADPLEQQAHLFEPREVA